MKTENLFESKIKAGDFIITAEYLPRAGTNISVIDTLKNCMVNIINVADNPHGPVLSSLAASAILKQSGLEPVFQIVTRDRNRIAIQSDLLGAASLGIKNVLCLSGYHQSLSAMPQAANVYDIDSIQLIEMVTSMDKKGKLMDGSDIEGDFSMLAGAVANPYLKPLDLNVTRIIKKAEAGARFIQTQAVFDIISFQEWLDTLNKEGLTQKVAIIAGILPLTGYSEAKELCSKHTDFYIPDALMKRINDAGDEQAQKGEGLKICMEIIKDLRGMKGLRGIHILSGGKEELISGLVTGSGLIKK